MKMWSQRRYELIANILYKNTQKRASKRPEMATQKSLDANEGVFRVQFYVLVNQFLERLFIKGVQLFVADFAVKGRFLRCNKPQVRA